MEQPQFEEVTNQSLSPDSTTFNDGYNKAYSDEDKSCLICGHISHGFHFGISACRACAAFFRRTVAEKKVYKCRQQCNCPIRKDMRNTCRHCRFLKCLALGMNKNDVQMNRDPIGRRRESPKVVECCAKPSACCDNGQIRGLDTNSEKNNNDPSPFSSTINAVPTIFPCFVPTVQPSPIMIQPISDTFSQHLFNTVENVPTNLTSFARGANEATMMLIQNATELAAREERLQNELKMATSQPISLLPYTPLSGTSILQRIQEGYSNYQSSQKSLYTVMCADNIFAEEKYRLVKHSEHVKMKRGCLSLMFSMVNDWFQPFDSLDQTVKVLVLRAFSTSFSCLDQCFKTMRAFPNSNDTRFVLLYGQYVDFTNLEYFFSENKDPNTASSSLIRDIIRKFRVLTNKMVRLQVREVEIAALLGLILWNEVSNALAPLNNTDNIRDRIYSELHNNIILNYGIMETGPRMGSLLSLLQDVNTISKEIRESPTIGQILNPHVSDI